MPATMKNLSFVLYGPESKGLLGNLTHDLMWAGAGVGGTLAFQHFGPGSAKRKKVKKNIKAQTKLLSED
jgi:hypothetical protein